MFAKKFQGACVVLALLHQTSAALAQNNGSDYGWRERFYQPVAPLPPDLGFTYHHASTAGEGWQRGRAAVIHARGNYWLSVSQAAIQFEVARSLDQYNHRQWIAFCVANRERLKADRHESTEATRLRNEAQHSEKFEAAYRLAPEQLDRTSGEIAWPEVLKADAYGNLRQPLDDLFREQGHYAGKGDGRAANIVKCVESLRRAVRRDLGTFSRADYATAQRFLCGLKYEAEVPLGAASNDPGSALTQIN